MAIFKNGVAIKKIRVWMGGPTDLIPLDDDVEDPPGSGLFLLDGDLESPAASGLFLLETGEGASGSSEHHVIKVYYWDEDGEHVVFDGTQSQNKAVPVAIGFAQAHAVGLSVTPGAISAPVADASTEAETPVIAVSTALPVVVATATATALAPAATSSRTVDAPPATSQAQAEQIISSPTIATPAAAATADAKLPTTQVQGSNFITVPLASANADSKVPVVSASREFAAPVGTAQASTPQHAYSISRTITSVVATATAGIPTPEASTAGDAMAMDKSGTQAITYGGWYKVTGMVARTGSYPNTVLVDNGLVMNGPIDDRTLSFRARFASAHSSQRFQVRANGSVLAEIGNDVLFTGQIDAVTSANIELWAYTGINFPNQRTIQSGAFVSID